MYEKGFTHALRWNSWDHKRINPYEKILSSLHGDMSYDYQRTTWAGAFGSGRGRNGYKPYFIYVRNEAMLTAALLGANV